MTTWVCNSDSIGKSTGQVTQFLNKLQGEKIKGDSKYID